MGVQGVQGGRKCPVDWDASPTRDFSQRYHRERATLGQTNISEFELGYASAFLEAEGSFCVANEYKDRWYVSMVAYQSPRNMYPLLYLQKLFGGSISRDNPSRPHHVCAWGAAGERAIRVMRLIYPHMSPWRQGQIDKALNAWKNQEWGVYPDMPKDIIVADMGGLHP